MSTEWLYRLLPPRRWEPERRDTALLLVGRREWRLGATARCRRTLPTTDEYGKVPVAGQRDWETLQLLRPSRQISGLEA